MNQKLYQISPNFIFIFFFIFCLNIQSNAQIEFKLNPPAALFGLFQIGFELPKSKDWGLEAEFLFFSVNENVVGGLFVHGKYYFNPDLGADKIYAGVIIGGIAGDNLYDDKKEQYALFGLEMGYKWFGKRNVLLEVGGGVNKIAYDDIGIIPYARLMLGYRFPLKEKN